MTDRYHIYGRKGCNNCNIAKKILEQYAIRHKIKYVYIDIDLMHKNIYDKLKMECSRKSGRQIKQLPIILINHGLVSTGQFTFIGGYKDMIKHLEEKYNETKSNYV